MRGSPMRSGRPMRGRGVATRTMRHTKTALLLFGAALVLGLFVSVTELDWLERVGAAAIALAILLIPAAMLADLWRAGIRLRLGRRRPQRKTPRRRPAQARRRARPRR